MKTHILNKMRNIDVGAYLDDDLSQVELVHLK